MRVADTADKRSVILSAVFIIEFFRYIRLRPLQACIVGFRPLLTHIQEIQRIVQCLDNPDVIAVLRIQKPCRIIGHCQIIVVLLGRPVEHFHCGIQKQMEISIPGICGQNHPVRPSRLRLLCQDNFSVIDIQPLNPLSVHEDGKLGICRIPSPFRTGLHLIDDALPVKFLRNCQDRFKPVVLPVTAPDLSPAKRVPGRRIKVFNICETFRTSDHPEVRYRRTFRIDSVLKILQHLADAFLDKMHDTPPLSALPFPYTSNHKTICWRITAPIILTPMGSRTCCRPGR